MVVSGSLVKKGTIKLVSLGEDSECLEGMKSTLVTENNGNYNMNIVDGSYTVEIMYDDEYIYQGILTVRDGTISSPLT